METPRREAEGFTRRGLLKAGLAGGVLGVAGWRAVEWFRQLPRLHAQTFVGRAPRYDAADLTSIVLNGLRALGVDEGEIRGKRILLKPNLVETYQNASHINTHPVFVRAVAEAFLRSGAGSVVVAEGPGHRVDTLLVVERSGLADVLHGERIPFVNLNDTPVYTVANAGQRTNLASLTFPAVFREIDWIVSLPKLKTHHWVGVTLSMKNLFGVMPGIYYGWPKNVLHYAGIGESILDINATLRPHFAIVDGVVGMEGDGPIMGSPVSAGVVVMGRNLPAVDATCARLMGIDPHRIAYLAAASNWLGPIHESHIHQVGEPIAPLRTIFRLLDTIPAEVGIRLT